MRVKWLFIILCILIIFGTQTDQPTVSFLDVDQGLSVLFTDNNGWQLLYDGGPGNNLLPELAKEMPITDNTIDVIALSHTHRDHIEGLIEVLNRYQVNEIWWSGVNGQGDVFTAWQEAVSNSGARVIEIKAGWERLISSGWVIRALHPTGTIIGTHPHDSALVLQLVSANQTITLTGDLEDRNEQSIIQMCQQSLFLRCVTDNNLLQVSHHGSRNTTKDEWLDYFNPQQAIISVGEGNNFGHPHQETLDRLNAHGIPYFRTDQTGTIIVPLTNK